MPICGDPGKAFCTLGQWEFILGHGGKTDLRQHAANDGYKKKSTGQRSEILTSSLSLQTLKVTKLQHVKLQPFIT